MQYQQYNKTKFRPIDKLIRHINTKTNEVEYKQAFVCTSGYRNYLNNKERYEDYQRIVQQKAKIQYQIEHYGEADRIEISLLTALVQRYKQKYNFINK